MFEIDVIGGTRRLTPESPGNGRGASPAEDAAGEAPSARPADLPKVSDGPGAQNAGEGGSTQWSLDAWTSRSEADDAPASGPAGDLGGSWLGYGPNRPGVGDAVPPDDDLEPLWSDAEPGPLPCDDPGPAWPVFGELPPSPETSGLLTTVGVADLDEFDLVEAVAAWERIGGWASAQQAKALAELVRRPMFAELSSLRDGLDPIRGVALEVSARLRISVREAEQRIDLAAALATDWTATLTALAEGVIDYWRARTIVDGAGVLEDSRAARTVEQQTLAVAGEVSRATLRKKIEKAVIAADPASAEECHQRALADRQVRTRPEPAGMGSTWALLSAYDTSILDRVLDAAATGMKRACPEDGRTHAQCRADALATMAWTAWRSGWIGGPVDGSEGTERLATDAIRLSGRGGGRPEIAVIVPLSTLIGLDDQPAELGGYGPIPASIARRIAADGVWRRLLTDPVTGQVLDYGRTRYRPPQDLIDHVIMRDQTCCGIACSRPAQRCDIDHTIRYPDGPTSAENLGPPCRVHHNGKTHAGWRLSQPEPGRFDWRSPTGHRYQRPPEQVGPIIESPRSGAQSDQAGVEPPVTEDPDPPPF